MKFNTRIAGQKIREIFKNKASVPVALGVLALAAAAAGYFFITSTKDAKTYTVVLSENGFTPASLTVKQGDLIKFSTTLKDPFWPASDPHPLHSLYPQFDPKKPVNPGEVWTFKAGKIGLWAYHDHLFPANKGIINVVSKSSWEIRGKVLKRDDLLTMVGKDGPQKTYSNLKQIYDESSLYAHSTFHLFGEVLYTKFGLDGIQYCDNFAGFGCYHGFFIKAVSDKGLDVAIDLDKYCVEKFGPQGLGCPHGIGHGLVEYFGLGLDKINQALVVCSKLTWQGPLFGCAGGVFMENNFPTVFDKNGVGTVTTREAHGNLLEPCLSVPDKFKMACYYEQASWWNQTFKGDYKKIGGFCSSLANSDQRDSCFLGMGNSAAEVGQYNINYVTDECAQISNKRSEAVCRAGGAWAFFANPAERALSESVCEGLGPFQSLCLDKRILVK